MKSVFKIIAITSIVYACFHILDMISRVFYIRDDVKGAILFLVLVGSVSFDLYMRRKRREK